MSLGTGWERKDGQVTHYIHIDYRSVVIGSHMESGHTDNASSCGYDAFLGGHFHDHIRNYFNDSVLNAVVESVKNAAQYPAFVQKNKLIEAAVEALEQIPLDPTIGNIFQAAATEKGSKNYGNMGGYKTEVHSRTRRITIERSSGMLIPADGGKPIPIEFPGHASGVVASQDHFFVVVNDDFVVVTPNGDIRPNEMTIFGSDIRIEHVYRRDDVVCFGYRWFDGSYPPGLLRYDIRKGVVGRWVAEK